MKYKHLIFNKINIFTNFLVVAFLLAVIFVPNKIFAVSINASSESAIASGDTGIIDIFLDTEGELINSVDGSIILSDTNNSDFEVKDISLVNSSFTIWPRKPSLENKQKISFVGGIPGGVNGNKFLLFKIIIKINKPGNFSIKPDNIVAFLNDGLGTSRNITKNISNISVGVAGKVNQDKWKEIISNDNMAPEPFKIKLIQDPNLFNGKKFISFETTDGQSGINYYEVKEGNYPIIRTGTAYVLIDQNKSVDITVIAYDKAGNFQVTILEGKEPIHWLSVIVSVLIILLIYIIIKRIFRKKKLNAK